MRTHSTSGWLAFELSVLNRLRFSSVAIPFADRPDLGAFLKMSGIRVLANSPFRSSYAACQAHILNTGEGLSEDDVAVVLEDAYVPQYRLRNPALRNWFGETDSWWFDNVRANIERLQSEQAQALALTVGAKVGDYVLSFDEESARLRQPLSRVFERLLTLEELLPGNGEDNACSCSDPVEFTAESYTDLYFLRLPSSIHGTLREELGEAAWKEVWVRGDDGFWPELEETMRGRLGSHVETKSQYLEMLTNALNTAKHIKQWAIEHVEDGFMHTQEIVEAVAGVRKVDTVFTKDFSELAGIKAVIITA